MWIDFFVLIIYNEEEDWSVKDMDIFCKIVQGEIPSKCLYEDNDVMVIMDVSPRSDGHCLIIPKRHYQDLYDIEKGVLNHIMEVAQKIAKILMEKLDCDGITLEQNNGTAQEVKHIHLHIIPKYNGQEKVVLGIETVFHKVVDK